ncbi:helix-turn-helix domain-containing protein [Comamonas sp. JC664]|uniref:helix-turn-helix domain-containing protein n=1 Tax=Comamonas sp. JC664 TaxID=2801917 RepID=UPI0036177A01
MAKATGFPRPTVHRIVAALQAERMLVEVGSTRCWTWARAWYNWPAAAGAARACAWQRPRRCVICAMPRRRPSISPCPRATAWSISKSSRATAPCRCHRALAPA